MIEIDISHESDEMAARAPSERVDALLRSILRLVGKREYEISCSFVSDGTMQQLNSAYRGKDESTDILSFVQSDDDEGFFYARQDDEPEVLGDLVISLDAMDRNCVDFSVPASEELARLLVHGVLHLCGWDHETNDPQEVMLRKQEELLETVLKESVS
ncbi:MAG: rRNA maturation RNase YbeY [Sphaerochaetaceae bacterium]|jgi:probable rRNA maturation factor|nr:rRNA maturation RNase YbeY [Sphaerochaetaceae bacterium]MDD3941514.1 rRNA maturation RNase YbeY [Sphaerochaetaceae bacterium]MDX9938902.1 rRNA maturation RNase YbeY [Sphaerochaetaceae bacterium]